MQSREKPQASGERRVRDYAGSRHLAYRADEPSTQAASGTAPEFRVLGSGQGLQKAPWKM